MANRFTDPRPQFSDATPSPFAGGFLYFYETGSTTPADTYSDSTLSTANSNPVELDSAGRLPNDVFLDPNITYKVQLTDADGVPIWTADPVDDPAANVSAALQVYAGNPNGNLAGSAGTPGGSGSSAVWDITNNLLYVCTTSGSASTAVWTQVGATLAGGVQMTGVISPTALAADQNDYTPTGNAAASWIRQDASANVIITGLANGTTGFLKVITNISADKTITLADQSSSSTAANRFAFTDRKKVVLYPGESISLIYDSTSSRWRPRQTPVQDKGIPFMPGGRLTLESGVPVSSSDQTARTTVYYEAYLHNFVPVWNGYNFYSVNAAGVSQTLADNTKSPAAAAVSSLYDMFIWDDDGTVRLSRGPAWSSATSRGTGAGTTELERKNGVYVNKVAISNGPGANKGTYVGTIATDGNGSNGQLNMMMLPSGAAGGANNRFDVWNMYNRVRFTFVNKDNTDSWTYSTDTWRAANNSNNNRVTVVAGLAETYITIRSLAYQTGAGTLVLNRSAIGVDSTSSPSAAQLIGANQISGGALYGIGCSFGATVPLGQHYYQHLERASGASVSTWYGDNGDSGLAAGISGEWWC